MPVRKLLLFVLLFGGLSASSQAQSTIIPANRATVWKPGIAGGVPVRTTVCATVNATTYGNGAQDATAGIQAALNACPVGQVVQLTAGSFAIASRLTITTGIVLRGMGPTQTKLLMPVGTNSNVITIGTQWFKFMQSTNLATNAVKDAYSVTLSSMSGFTPALQVGEIVCIDELTDPSVSQWGANSPLGDPSRGWFTRTNRPLGQIMEIASVSGTTVTFTTPFHISYQTAFTAQLSRFSSDGTTLAPAVEYAGVEDLYVSGGSGGQGNVWMENAAYSWFKNLESDYQNGISVQLDATFRCIVRDSYIHSAQDSVPGGGAYGIGISLYSADNLIENNIVWNQNKVMVMRAAGGGNVIGYNYMEDGWITYAATFVETGINASHMTTSHMELFEGNQGFNFDGDGYWGGAVYITVFRNHFTGKRRNINNIIGVTPWDAGDLRAIGLNEGHWWYTFVGNVLGTLGQTPAPSQSFTYQNNALPSVDDPWPMWKLGYNSVLWTTIDSQVVSTAIRDGNYDYVTNSVHWDDPVQTLPASLYLTAKPAFFGGNVWPWVDPLTPPYVNVLPARLRFDTLMGLVTSSPPPAPTGLRLF